MNHTLKINNGARSLAFQILNLPEQFKTPSDLIRAAHLVEKLKVTPPEQEGEGRDKSKVDAGWLNTDAHIELTEAQRDLLKTSVSSKASHIPPSAYALNLLTELGFVE